MRYRHVVVLFSDFLCQQSAMAVLWYVFGAKQADAFALVQPEEIKPGVRIQKIPVS